MASGIQCQCYYLWCTILWDKWPSLPKMKKKAFVMSCFSKNLDLSSQFYITFIILGLSSCHPLCCVMFHIPFLVSCLLGGGFPFSFLFCKSCLFTINIFQCTTYIHMVVAFYTLINILQLFISKQKFFNCPIELDAQI